MKKLFSILAMAASLTACHHQNPLLQEWDTPYGIPPFDQIQTSDYIPALKQGIAEHNAEIEAIVVSRVRPDFDNTIAPLELSGKTLARVVGVLFNVAETDRSDALDEVLDEAIGLMSDHEAELSFNKELYKRISEVYHADQSHLTREQQVVLKKHFDSFERSGIGLPEEQQNELKEIEKQIAQKTQKVGNNILAESNAFRQKFGISVSEYSTEMTTCEDRERRKALFEAYTMRGHNGNENDNSALALEILRLRSRKAQILGYENFAQYQLANKMAANPQTVDGFLAGIMKSAVKRANAEIKDMEAIAGHPIEPWDWWYYAEKVRKAKYDLDDDIIRPYFHIDSVAQGIFKCAEILYGVHPVKLEDVPAYNTECVTTYKIVDAQDNLVGIFTTDYHPRASKRGGAWMNNVRDQYVDAEGNDIRPIIVNVGNLPEYLSVDDVQTVFHEFGHALHGLLTKCNYSSVSGTSVTRDFVEMFSQFNENWAFLPWMLDLYAKNAEGQTIPAELVSKINAALQFNQGFMTTELAAASILDMKWHELSDIPEVENPGAFIDEFEKKVCGEMGLIDQIVPRYRTTYFNHIFSSGYSAGYYGYLWAEVLDKDAFSKFTTECVDRKGNWDMAKVRVLSEQFKQTFLEKGGSEEPMVLYKSFMGREPQSDAMLAGRGLK